MKQIVSLLLALLIAAAIAGCGVEKEPLQYKDRMQYAGCTIKDGIETAYIWIDSETGVCYLQSRTGITVMVDREGKPFIANGWRDWGGDDE